MDTKVFHLDDLHFEHRLWTNRLNFFKEEIVIFEHRLEQLVSSSDNKEMLAELAHFQNQFIRHKEVVDEFVHDIKMKEHELVVFAKTHNEEEIDNTSFEDHAELRDRMDTFNKIYTDLKERFKVFSAKW